MFILQVFNYLNRSHDCLWDEPSALLAIPFLRQPLNELDFIIDEVVAEHTVLLIWRGLTIGVDEVDGASMANKHGGVDGKAVGWATPRRGRDWPGCSHPFSPTVSYPPLARTPTWRTCVEYCSMSGHGWSPTKAHHGTQAGNCIAPGNFHTSSAAAAMGSPCCQRPAVLRFATR